jgi:hypothetical protein
MQKRKEPRQSPIRPEAEHAQCAHVVKQRAVHIYKVTRGTSTCKEKVLSLDEGKQSKQQSENLHCGKG